MQVHAYSLIKKRLSVRGDTLIEESKPGVRSGLSIVITRSDHATDGVEGQMLLQSVGCRCERTFLVSFLPKITAGCRWLLAPNTFQSGAHWSNYDHILVPLSVVSFEGPKSSLPLCLHQVVILQKLSSASTAPSLHYPTQELFHSRPRDLSLNINGLRYNPITVDLNRIKHLQCLFQSSLRSCSQFYSSRRIALGEHVN